MTPDQDDRKWGPPAPPWGPAEEACCERLLTLALAEDLGSAGDVTSQTLIPDTLQGRAAFTARDAGVVAGLPALIAVFQAIDPAVRLAFHLEDGASVERGTVLAAAAGPVRSILAAERTALNFLQRLSGVATLTRRFASLVADLPCKLLDTRKTTPGWRALEKYAVRCGGGHNHRQGLYDMILIKDNHLAALGTVPDPIGEAVRRARQPGGNGLPVEVEVDSLEQLDRALAARPDFILLDNMTVPMLREAVVRRDRQGAGIQLEASGGVSLATVRAIALAGVNRISVGALTHSAVALDVGLDWREERA